MPNQMIALQARVPQAPNLGTIAAQYGNAMTNIANMEKMRREKTDADAIRTAMSDPTFNPADAASLNKLIALGPGGVAAAEKVMQAQKTGLDITGTRQNQAAKRVEMVGAGLIGLLRDPSDATLAQTSQTFKAVGMDPAEYEGVLGQISKIPDANARKIFALQFIAQSPNAQGALKYVMPDIKPEKVGDASVYIDNNANSPTFGKELFRITASPEPVKLNQQVVDTTLYNVNPMTGVAQEAVMGDATQGLVSGPRTLTRSDTGVVSPYAVGAPAATGASAAAPAAGFATPAAAPSITTPTAGKPPVSAAPRASRSGPVTVDVLLPAIVAQESGGNYTLVSPKGAMGAYQVMPKTAKTLAQRAGLAWRPELMTSASAEGKQYQDVIGRAAIKEAVDASGGGLVKAAKYYHGGSNQAAWGPKTRQYAQDIQARLSGGGGNGGQPAKDGAAPAAPRTVSEAAKKKAFGQIMPIIGYNAETGASRVEDLIKASTSGAVEMFGSEIMGAATGEGTPGRKALGELSAIAENMTFEKLRGKLGAQISDADVRLIARTMADIANGNTPANVRAAAWKNVVLPILLRGAGVEAPARGGGNASAGAKRRPLSAFGGR